MTRFTTISGRLDRILVLLWPQHSRARIAKVVRAGGVTVDGTVVRKPASIVEVGSALTFDVPPPTPMVAQAQDLPITIVYQDGELAVINKAPGMVVHPGAGHPDGTLVNALLFHLNDLSGIGGQLRPGIVHRLDKGTSGLLVVAKTDRAHACLAAQFADHSAGRTYTAICVGSPRHESGTITSNLGRHPKHRTRFTSVEEGKHAVTHWRVQHRFGSVTMLHCQLETGRTHQIRVHLTEAGWPLLGDPLYGNARAPASIRDIVDPQRPLLHAHELRFAHPDGHDCVHHARLPSDMLRVLDTLNKP